MTNCYSDRKFLHFFILEIIGLIVAGVSGKPPSRITGGTLAMPGEFKYMVALMENGRHLCGGAIISQRHILTAGHCVDGEHPPNVVTGVIDLRDPHGLVHNVSRVIIHPDFIPYTPTTTMECDIALIVLKTELELGGNLEKVNLSRSQVGIGRTGIIAGWGYTSSNYDETSFLYKMTVQFLNERNCIAKGVFLTPNRLCGYQSHATICGGDSGSPVVIGRAVVGIASASDCLIGNAHVYTNVFYYRDWILETMNHT